MNPAHPLRVGQPFGPSRRLLALLLCGLLLLPSSGCASKAAAMREAEAAGDGIHTGMSRGDVLAILGQPLRTRTDPDGIWWIYRFEDSPALGLQIVAYTGIVLLVAVSIGILLLIGALGGNPGGGGGGGLSGPRSYYAYLHVHLDEGVVDKVEARGSRR